MLHDPELHYLDNAATTIVAPEVAEVIDKTVNVDRLLELCTVEFSGEQTEGVICSGNRKIAIARDEAFNCLLYTSDAADD